MVARLGRALAALSLLILASHTGRAYTTIHASEPTWPSGNFTYVINASSFSAAGLSPAAVQGSFSIWAIDPVAVLTCTRDPADTSGTGTRDNINEVYYVASGWAGGNDGVLAVTSSWFIPATGTMTEADILVNGEWFDWDSPTTGGCSNVFDLQATVTHEAGHALGLDHSSDQAATMYFAGGPCDTSTQSLECDDKAGIRYLYPPGGTPRADWTQSAFTATPSGGDIAPGVNISISGTATNTGSLSTSAGLSGLFVSPSASVPVGSPTKTQTLPGKTYCATHSVGFTQSFTAGDAGTRYLVVKLDSSGTTTEYSETDASNVAFLGPYNVVTAPIVEVDQSALTFDAVVAAANPAAQSVLITNSGGGTFTWSAADDRSWISVAPTSGAPGASCAVSINTAGLSAGTHAGTVTITAPGATGSPKAVAITLNLTSGATLAVSPGSLSFNAAPSGALPPSQQLSVSNTGGGTLSWTASDDAAWLSVSPAGGTNAGTVTVSVTTTALAAGQYSANVTIDGGSASGSPAIIPVTLTLSNAILSVTPASLTFGGPVGGPAPASQQLSVTNAGTGALSYSASSDRSWLSVTPTSGAAPASLSVSVNPAGLAAGTQAGAITVTSAGAAGSPAIISVSYTLSSQPSIGLSATTMSFAAQQGTAAAAQTLTITNDGSGTLSYAVADDAAWLSQTPPSGTLTAGTSRAHQVNASAAALAAGSYVGHLTVTDPAANDSPRQVTINFEVTANPPLIIAPTTMLFAATAAQPTPATQSLVITTGGSATAAWSIASSKAWLTATPSSGIGPATVAIAASAAQGVPTGANLGTLTVTAPSLSGSPKTLDVTLQVAAGPRLAVSPSAVSFSAVRLAPVPPATGVSVTNAGIGSLPWTATGAPSWLQVSPSSGSAPGAFTLQPTRTDLSAGRYTATINVSAVAAYDTPQFIAVTYDIIGPAVTFAPERLTFDVVGGLPASSSATVALGAGGAWTAAANRPWLSVSPTSGSGNSTLTVSLIGAASLPIGLLDGAVIVTQSGASNSPAPVPVIVASRSAPALSVWPESIAGDIAAGTTVQSLAVVTLDEAADGLGAWTLGARPSWLRVDAETGVHGARLALSVDPSGLPAGAQVGTLEIDAEEGTLELPLSVTIHSAPKLRASPTTIALIARANGASSTETLGVTNVGSAPHGFTATPSQSWIVVTGSLTAPSTLSISALATSLAAGTYSGLITLASGASSVNVPVTLTVAPAAAPLADFTVSPLTGCQPLAVLVDNLTLGATSQQWIVDGVNVATFFEGALPAITKPGEHVVTLTATNAGGSSSRSRRVSVTMPPLASAGPDRALAFEADGQTRVQLSAARVAAAAPARIASIAWTTTSGTFEDSGTTTSSLERPALLLSSGRGGISSTLTLSVTDDRGCVATDQATVAVLSDLDNDGDGKIALADNCPAVANTSQSDFDADGAGDACDTCAFAADATQADRNANGLGDACDSTFRKSVSLPDLRTRICELVASIKANAGLSVPARRLRLDLSGGRTPVGATALGVAAGSGGTARLTTSGSGVELLVPIGLRFDLEDVLAVEIPLQAGDQLVNIPCAAARVGFVHGEVAGTCDASALDLRADGDVTGPSGPNGVVDVGDVVKLLRVSVSLDTLSADALARGDIAPGAAVAGLWQANSDCRIDVGDVVIALRASVGLVTLP